MRGCILLISFATVFHPISPNPSAAPPIEPAPTATVYKRSSCIKVNQCKCIMTDGSGIIDLASLGDADGFLERLKPLRTDGTVINAELLLSFSPCLPFSDPEDFVGTACTDVATCLVVRFQRNNRYLNRYLNYGRHIDNHFHYNDTMKTLTVSYFASSGSQPLTVVHYHCSAESSVSATLSFTAEVPLQIWVESPCACLNACTLEDVGPGTIFLIMLCLSATAYFILGACALRPFRTSQAGVQIAPEDSVWCMLCYQFTDRQRVKPRRRHISIREDTL
ncbi:uncharacterized protein LOC134445140 [Engraulis encrasicolus]|uniref:uncharacterized protein LOC134445140 n=1 Tax=Engraulis encrasicolus TaxID=184585 RepID=UPI002FD59996